MGAHKHKVQHNYWRVGLSAGLVLVLFLAYLWADIVDVLPGPLSLHSVNDSAVQPVRNIVEPAPVVPLVKNDKPIDKDAAQKLINDLSQTAGVGPDFSAVIMGADGTIAAEHELNTLRQPASTMKTLTAAAAASVLDMGSRIRTAVYIDEAAEQNPHITLKGEGDMLLSKGEGDPIHVNGRAGLATLADKTAKDLRSRSINSVHVNYDSSFFGPVRSPESIGANNPSGIYFTPTATMAVDEGRERSDQDMAANPDAGGVYVPHTDDTEGQVARVFAEELGKRGITVIGPPTAQQLVTKAAPIAQVESAPLNEILALTLRTSDNTLTELFGRLLAHATGEEDTPRGAVQAVLKALQTIGIDVNAVRMADCSGLSPGSLVSVSTLVAIERAAVDGKHKQLIPLVDGLSVVGLVGTAAKRGHGNDPDGLVRVKTGTLEQVTALAGNVSRFNGGVLVFAVIVNNPTNMDTAIQAVNTFMSALPRL